MRESLFDSAVSSVTIERLRKIQWRILNSTSGIEVSLVEACTGTRHRRRTRQRGLRSVGRYPSRDRAALQT
jgi:hypothetical protein